MIEVNDSNDRRPEVCALEPTAEQIESYRRDGFLVVEDCCRRDEVDRLREHFAACFEHDWETGHLRRTRSTTSRA